MDAEIGVRNLADSFRYNVLPDVVKALGLMQDKLRNGIESFEDLPEYEQLWMLVSSQLFIRPRKFNSEAKRGYCCSQKLRQN